MKAFDSLVIEFDLKHHSFKRIALEELNIDRKEAHKIYWVHSDLNKRKEFKQISEKLRLPTQVSKIGAEKKCTSHMIDTNDALTLQIQHLTSHEINDNYEVDFGNLLIHLTANFCFTASAHPSPVLFEFLNNCHQSVHYAKTPCFILFLIFEGVINEYASILFDYEEITDELDIEVRKNVNNIYSEVVEAKHQVMKMKRYMIAIREILMRITSRNISVISEQCRTSLYNLSNHSHLVVNEIDSIRDVFNSLLGQIDNGLMQKMSAAMRVLTAYAAIFLPLTLITGIYGMNFEWIPELKWKYGYFWALSLLIICAVFLILFFKKKKWF
ncbi:magnesium transporter CorA family protein [Legionella waltersii]|uniref:Magnesium and cobalt transport protein CorA n=1 Tax=Legionella waltersii TaxID=66969 RepID=A0A0W1ADN9_9GAMM|nr:magnesium transporter CorA family protein [Legionella waltersii]KTD79438.1 magnesium and cobalt transport protein CorA [Legionella waltersii]SNU97655.1 magnesium and cobalt transport protein CorA [Legionella waltersii]